MSRTYFIEILNNNGEVLSRHKSPSLPLHIGRGYHNDIIIDDPHVAAEHALIDVNDEGAIVLRDLGSLNGIRLNNNLAPDFIVHGDDTFHLGHTQIRIRTNDYIVAPEITNTDNHRWEGWPRALFATLIIMWIAFSNTWLGDVAESKSSTYITDICYWLGIAIAWSGMWALGSRVFGGSARFSRHLLILSVGLFTLDIFGYLTQFFAFALSWEFFTRYGSHIEIAIFAVVVFYHLRQITPRRAKRLKLICASLAVFGSGLILLKNYQNTNQLADEFYMHEMLPPMLRISRYHSLQEFDAKIADLRKDVEMDRDKTIKDKEQHRDKNKEPNKEKNKK